jgi:hypothetical protein
LIDPCLMFNILYCRIFFQAPHVRHIFLRPSSLILLSLYASVQSDL